MPVVLYGCQTGSVTFREEHRLSMFENGLMKNMLRPKGNEVTGDWRSLHGAS